MASCIEAMKLGISNITRELSLRRQVQGSLLVDSFSKLQALATLLEQPAVSLKLETLFSTQESGWCNPAAFHSACDNKGPTLVLVKAADGSSFGGYTSISWTSSETHKSDNKAFLFRFASFAKSTEKPEKFQRNGNGYELVHAASSGPIFGSTNQYDLLTFTSSGISMTCSPYSYASSGPLITTSLPKQTQNFQLEVLLVSSMASYMTAELDKPWMEGCSWKAEDYTTLKKQVFEFSPANEGLPVKQINILLCGGVGAGKSSIISTVDSICQQRISRRAPHGQGTGSMTRKLHKYGFKDPATKENAQWKLWDSMGWGASDYKKGELGFILDGNLPNKCKLDDAISMKTEGFKLQPGIADAVHCMCLVVPCESATDETYMQRLREMRQFARDRDIPTLVFLTKIDSYDPDVIGEDLKKTFHSERLLSLMEDLEESSGVGGRKDILPIKNLSKETSPTPEAGVLICRAIQQALYAAVDYLRQCDESYMSADEELKSST